MRLRQDRQGRLEFQRSTLKVTNEFYDRYAAISEMLDAAPEVLRLLDADVAGAMRKEKRRGRALGRRCAFTSENVLRALICQVVEGLSLREVVVRIDDSSALRTFVRIHDDPMMDYSTLCKLRNAVQPDTWKQINRAFTKFAISSACIEGGRLRLDTTLVETNVRWPSDSGLLWDVSRVLARLVRRARELVSMVADDRRLRDKAAKKLQIAVAREAGRRRPRLERMKRLYVALIGRTEAIREIARTAASDLDEAIADHRLHFLEACVAGELAKELRHFVALGRRVCDQARRRVLADEQVPSAQKLYSIFEPHTELIKRGKAGKPIEFGHMVSLAQVNEKFISSYAVFERRPSEHELLEPIVRDHKKLFGHAPSEVSADKAYHQADAVARVADQVDLVAIGRRRSKDEQDAPQETDALFKIAQAFRAGIEGTISFLKRSLRMFRCFDKGLEHFSAAIGRIVFGHNLIVLARHGPA